jgi:heme/copper-type cytochrome/quinol oxidase subunit 2
MKTNTKRAILSAAGLMLSARNALAEDMMDKAVKSLDPSVQPWAGMAVTLLRAVYIIGVGGGVMYYAGTYYLQRKQGHTTQASEAKTMFLEVAGIGIGAFILSGCLKTQTSSTIG